ncbi:MAG: thiol-disulfide isomerase/thioredoxin [Alphaproteobacteria bacterium]
MQIKSKLYQFSFVLLLLIVTACGAQNDNPTINKPFKNFQVKTLKGDDLPVVTTKLTKPTLVNIWATWCAPCVRELPALEKIAEKGDFDVVALSTDAQASKVSDFVIKHGLQSIQFLFDAHGRGSRAYLNAQGLPVTFLLDKAGVVRQVYLGEKDWLGEDFSKKLYKAAGL